MELDIIKNNEYLFIFQVSAKKLFDYKQKLLTLPCSNVDCAELKEKTLNIINSIFNEDFDVSNNITALQNECYKLTGIFPGIYNESYGNVHVNKYYTGFYTNNEWFDAKHENMIFNTKGIFGFVQFGVQLNLLLCCAIMGVIYAVENK